MAAALSSLGSSLRKLDALLVNYDDEEEEEDDDDATSYFVEDKTSHYGGEETTSYCADDDDETASTSGDESPRLFLSSNMQQLFRSLSKDDLLAAEEFSSQLMQVHQTESAIKTPSNNERHPQSVLEELCSDQSRIAFDSQDAFWQNHTRVCSNAWIAAVRNGDLSTLQAASQKEISTITLTGESLVHIAARKRYSVLQYLVQDRHLSLQVHCQQGRNPLHDACWTDEPDWKVVDLLLDTCPSLLFRACQRGQTPLEYVPTSQWAAWNEYLQRKLPNLVWNQEEEEDSMYFV